MTYFVNSMSDLFHEDVPTSYIKQVSEVIEQAYLPDPDEALGGALRFRKISAMRLLKGSLPTTLLTESACTSNGGSGRKSDVQRFMTDRQYLGPDSSKHFE